MAAKRKRKGPAKVGPAPGGTIVISDEFTGYITKDGSVIDDTAYFRAKREEAPIRERLRDTPRIQELRAQLSEAMQKLSEKDERLTRDVALIHGWLHDVTIGIFAAMLREKK